MAQTHLDRLGISLPIIQAPMAGVDTVELAVAVSKAGGLGSLACAMLSPDDIRAAWRQIKLATDAPINLNFFCHQQAPDTDAQQQRWQQRLNPYYQELGIDIDAVKTSATRAPFDDAFGALVEEIKPPVVSFHFGLPSPDLLARVKACGAVVLSSATTVNEAVWLAQNGCDMIIAQGLEAGGHRATFLAEKSYAQLNTTELLQAIWHQVDLPVIAAGGLADAGDVSKVLSLGAVAAQIGTAYLFCDEANVTPLYKQALSKQPDTTLTNVFSGRLARGIVNRFVREVGPVSTDAPQFPYASKYVNPLRQASEKAGSTDFMQMWSGTKPRPHDMDAQTLTAYLGQVALESA